MQILVLRNNQIDQTGPPRREGPLPLKRAGIKGGLVMQSTTQLPEGHTEIFRLNLQKDKKTALLVNGLALLIAAVLIVAASFFVPITRLFDGSEGLGLYVLRFGVLIAGVILYMVLHELVHGICMKRFSGVSARYGFTGLYAYAGSDAYFGKTAYRIIALAPVVIWGIVLVVINLFCGGAWFWVVYFIQVCNIAGAAGDLYVSWKFRGFPPDILVQDTGVSMTVYSRAR